MSGASWIAVFVAIGAIAPGHHSPTANVVLVDDGLATGVTAQAAITAVRRAQPRRVLLCAPVSVCDTAARLSEIAEVICVSTPARFMAVGEWYHDFGQTSDDEVVELLDKGVS